MRRAATADIEDLSMTNGADLTFATPFAASPSRERQIQSSTGINHLRVVVLMPTFAKEPAEKGGECWHPTTRVDEIPSCKVPAPCF